VSPNELRHTAASLLLDDGAPIVDLAPVLDVALSTPAERVPSARCACLGGSGPCIRTGPTPMIDCMDCGTRLPLAYREGLCRTGSRHVQAHRVCQSCAAKVDSCGVCGHVRRSLSDVTCGCVAPPQRLASYHASHSQDPVLRAVGEAIAAGSLATPTTEDPLFGFELECMPHPGQPRFGGTHRDPYRALALSAGAWIAGCEEDGSLSDDNGARVGAEIVTRPYPIGVWRDALPGLYAAILALGTPLNPRCGGHIHVSRTLELERGARVVCASYGRPGQLAVWEAVAGRPCHPRYAPAPPQHPVISPAVPGGHGAALAMGGTGQTLEWSHPAGTDDARIALGRAELLVDVLRHAHAHHAEQPSAPWGWGLYLRDRPTPTPETAYAFALLRSVGY
jgi:hypothetical protein